MKPTVSSEKTRIMQEVVIGLADVTDGDVATSYGKKFRPEGVFLSYEWRDGEWRAVANVGGAHIGDDGKESGSVIDAWYVLDGDPTEDTPEWVQALIDEHRPSWTPSVVAV